VLLPNRREDRYCQCLPSEGYFVLFRKSIMTYETLRILVHTILCTHMFKTSANTFYGRCCFA